MKKIALLGSTGSIGKQALDVIKKNPGLFEVSVLACGSNIEELCRQIDKYHPKTAVCASAADAVTLQGKYPNMEILFGDEGLAEAVKGDCDVVLNALMGIRGLVPTYEAVKAGKDIALANKETLVAGGELIMKEVREKGVSLKPIDSEHSAIFQCMQGQRREDISRLIITGSGGPFRVYAQEALEHVTLDQALRHPNWNMGPKLTIDSATLMNKGLEVIEAMWLFGFGIDKIDVVIHPQSIIHSMIEMKDGAILAQMGTPDMRLPIAYALTHPDRENAVAKKLDLFRDAKEMTFEKPDPSRFPCLAIAMEAARTGGTYPAAMNGANEVLVQKFLERKIRFMDIPRMLDKVMVNHKVQNDLSIDVILEADRKAREKVIELTGE